MSGHLRCGEVIGEMLFKISGDEFLLDGRGRLEPFVFLTL
jgi:hypothetical protein